jgi:hypothetical protein
MTDKLAYIEYKNNHLFKYVQEHSEEEDIDELEYRIQTRSRSAVKIEDPSEE